MGNDINLEPDQKLIYAIKRGYVIRKIENKKSLSVSNEFFDWCEKNEKPYPEIVIPKHALKYVIISLDFISVHNNVMFERTEIELFRNKCWEYFEQLQKKGITKSHRVIFAGFYTEIAVEKEYAEEVMKKIIEIYNLFFGLENNTEELKK